MEVSASKTLKCIYCIFNNCAGQKTCLMKYMINNKIKIECTINYKIAHNNKN